jgi:neutral trehalase
MSKRGQCDKAAFILDEKRNKDILNYGWENESGFFNNYDCTTNTTKTVFFLGVRDYG